MSYVKTINEDGAVSDIMAKALDPATLVNGFTQTTAGEKALDAAAGKTLNDSLSTLDGAVVKKADLVNGFTQSTAGAKALDAVAGKTLYDRLDGFCVFGFNIPASGSVTLNVGNSARFMIVGTAPNTNAMLALLCATNGTGSATTVQELHLGSYITYVTGQNTLSLSCSHSSHTPKCLCIMFNNTPTVSISN